MSSLSLIADKISYKIRYNFIHPKENLCAMCKLHRNIIIMVHFIFLALLELIILFLGDGRRRTVDILLKASIVWHFIEEILRHGLVSSPPSPLSQNTHKTES